MSFILQAQLVILGMPRLGKSTFLVMLKAFLLTGFSLGWIHSQNAVADNLRLPKNTPAYGVLLSC